MNVQNLTWRGVLVWSVCALFFLYEFLLRTVVGTFQHPIMYDLELSSFKFSFLSSTSFLLIYALMQIPVGMIVDRVGLKRALIFASLVCSLSVTGFAFADNYPLAIVCRMLTGLGASFGFICLLVAVYDWLPQKHISFLVGFSIFFGTMGPMLAAGPLESLSHGGHVEWRFVFLSLGAIGLILAVLVFLFVSQNRSETGQFKIVSKGQSLKGMLKALFAGSQAWFIAAYSALVYFPLEYLSENEGKSFLILKGFDAKTAAYLITLSWLGYAIGCPVQGFLSDRFERRKPFLVFSAFCAAISIASVVFLDSYLMVLMGFLGIGLGASGQSIAYANIAEQFQKEYLALGLSLNNALIMVVAALNAPLIGWIIDIKRDVGVSALTDYDWGFGFLVGIVAVSVVFAVVLVKESFCKSQVDFTYLSRPGARR